MLVFGEICSYETIPTRLRDLPSDVSLFVVFNVNGREAETTLPVRGIRISHGIMKSQQIFPFNRPITANLGDRMFVQIVLVQGSKQKLIGYGFCDLNLERGKNSGMIDVLLWRPKATSSWGEFFGFMNPLIEPGIVEFPTCIDKRDIESVTVNGKLKVYIQICGYQ